MKRDQVVWRVDCRWDYESPISSKLFWDEDDARSHACERMQLHGYEREERDPKEFEQGMCWRDGSFAVSLVIQEIN